MTASDAKFELTTVPDEINVNSINITTIMRLGFSALVLVVINLAVTLGILDHYGLLQKQEIVSLDAADMVLGFVASQGPDASEEELAAGIQNLNANLDQAVQQFAQSRGVIVVNSAAVLGGTRDVTPDMLTALGLAQ